MSVVMIAELAARGPYGRDEDVRAQRLETLRAVQATYVALPIDDPVAAAFAELVATARRAGHRRRCRTPGSPPPPKPTHVAVYTQDSDFDDLAIDVQHV